MKLEVPYYSQYLDVEDEKWRKHACPIASLGMIIEYMNKRSGKDRSFESIDDLIYEGFELRGTGSYGWTHDALVWLSHNHGLFAYKEEFRSIEEELIPVFRKRGIEKIRKMLGGGYPVLVSGIRNWKEKKKFHTFVLIGYKEGPITSQESDVRASEVEGFYYHDSDSEDREQGMEKFVPTDVFNEHWRGLALFFYD